ncbi:hypothetical protein B0H12DRAFT_218738 [Mycena haematopus]|nr:hypothetical protein B0H12DRAFT_218738 [Mycena haematopus]
MRFLLFPPTCATPNEYILLARLRAVDYTRWPGPKRWGYNGMMRRPLPAISSSRHFALIHWLLAVFFSCFDDTRKRRTGRGRAESGPVCIIHSRHTVSHLTQ